MREEKETSQASSIGPAPPKGLLQRGHLVAQDTNAAGQAPDRGLQQGHVVLHLLQPRHNGLEELLQLLLPSNKGVCAKGEAVGKEKRSERREGTLASSMSEHWPSPLTS